MLCYTFNVIREINENEEVIIRVEKGVFGKVSGVFSLNTNVPTYTEILIRIVNSPNIFSTVFTIDDTVCVNDVRCNVL